MKTEISIEDAKAYISSIDFSMVIKKMVEHQGWLQKDAETVCQLYRNFLFLNKKYGHMYSSLPPSEDIDEFWHNHILDTQNYRRDCEAIFGTYFNHYPYFGIDGRTNFNNLESAFETMQKLHIQEYGEQIFQIRNGWSTLVAFFKKKIKLKPKRVAVDVFNEKLSVES